MWLLCVTGRESWRRARRASARDVSEIEDCEVEAGEAVNDVAVNSQRPNCRSMRYGLLRTEESLQIFRENLVIYFPCPVKMSTKSKLTQDLFLAGLSISYSNPPSSAHRLAPLISHLPLPTSHLPPPASSCRTDSTVLLQRVPILKFSSFRLCALRSLQHPAGHTNFWLSTLVPFDSLLSLVPVLCILELPCVHDKFRSFRATFMKRRKRRKIMRPSIDSVEEAAPMHTYKHSPIHTKLCINGVCSVHPVHLQLQAPTGFSDSDKADNLRCYGDGLHIEYKGPGKEEKDAASIRTDFPIPNTALALYYFEITIVDQGETGRIGVGLCNRDVKLGKMPGWDTGSYAYHGDDGLLFKQMGHTGENYGPKYGTDDVIGCCWDHVDRAVFFTKNGKHLGPAFHGLTGVLYPTVGMQSTSGRVRANFGRDRFVYDIEAHAQQQREKILSSIIARKLPSDYRILSDTVLAYLMHNGYSKTAAAFAKDAGRELIYQKERDSTMKRQAVCEKVLQGNIDGAIEQLEKQFPHVLRTQINIQFLLRTQKFIEMLVSGSGLEEAVQYGQRELSVFRDDNYLQSAQAARDPHLGKLDAPLPYSDILGDVYLLLAYGNPAESPTGELTKQSRREMVADRLNSAILASQGRPMRSILERFLTQSEVITNHLLQRGNGPAALISVQDLL